MSDGAELIAAERLRQVTAEGWTPEHDAEHTDGSMVRAAVCYASYGQKASAPYPLWPWADSWWKPSDDPIKNLVRAGALIAAEIDRIDGTTPTEPADELARLRAWKAEAMEVLGVWDQVHDALGSPAKLGQSKATASLAAAQRLVAPTEAAANGLEPGEIVAPRFYAMREQWSGEPICLARFYVVDSAGMGRIFLGRGVTAEALAKQIGLRPITEEGQS